MRTTVTLDPDVAELIRQRMSEQGASFKDVVNDAIRHGLIPAQRQPAELPPAFHLGEPRVPLDKALRLAGELDDSEIIRKLERRT